VVPAIVSDIVKRVRVCTPLMHVVAEVLGQALAKWLKFVQRVYFGTSRIHVRSLHWVGLESGVQALVEVSEVEEA
jgi:hypothetical protein